MTKYAWIMFFALIAAMFAIGYAFAYDNPNADCDYKPRQSDEVIVYCGTLRGAGSVSVRLCGINYAVEVSCK